MLGFDDYLKEQFNREETIQGYLHDAKQFMEYLKQEDVNWQSLKERHIKNYNMYLKQKGYSEHTIARKNSSLRLFLKHLRKEGIMLHNPMEDIHQPLLKKREVKITEEEKKALEEKMKDEARDYLLYVFLVHEKMKVSEIIEMKWDKIDEQNSILYLTKKAKSVKNETIDLLKNWNKENKTGYIFQSKHGKKLSVNGVHFIIKKYLKEINREDLRPNDLAK